MWPSLLRGPSVVRDFLVENFSSQKPRTREGILLLAKGTCCNAALTSLANEARVMKPNTTSVWSPNNLRGWCAMLQLAQSANEVTCNGFQFADPYKVHIFVHYRSHDSNTTLQLLPIGN